MVDFPCGFSSQKIFYRQVFRMADFPSGFSDFSTKKAPGVFRALCRWRHASSVRISSILSSFRLSLLSMM
jgi:hypothetical protein